MKKKLIPILIAAVLVVGGITGVVLANVIGKSDDKGEVTSLAVSGSGMAADGATSLPEDEPATSSALENLLPEDVSQPDIGGDTAPPEYTIDTTEDFDDGDFYTYFLDFSFYFHDKLTGVSDLRSISGYNWLTASFVANYAWAADYGQGIEYPMDDENHVLIPLTRLSEACEEILGMPYDFAELANGDFNFMVVEGSFTIPNGYDMMGAPYADLSTAKLSVKDTTIIVDVTIVQPDFDNENPETYGNFRYTFTLDNSQDIIPYRLVSIVAI